MSDSHDTNVYPGHDPHDVLIATMQSDVGYLKADVREIKTDIKEQGKKLDEMALNWQQFGGLTKMISDLADRLVKVENKAESHDTKIWIAYGAIFLIGVLVLPIFINVMSTYISNHLH